MITEEQFGELKGILYENQRLLLENNDMLKKQHAKNKRDFWLKIVWIFFILVAPTIFLYWYIMPMYSSLGSGSAAQNSLDQLNQLNGLLK
jgi:hypothetical protein